MKPFPRGFALLSLFVILTLLVGCSAPVPPTPTTVAPTALPPTTVPTAVATVAPPTALPPTSASPAVPPTAAPATTVPTAIPGAPEDLSGYIDDRSSPTGVLRSLFNAVNSQDYPRAYSYWEDPEKTVGPFPEYVKGYEDTESVQAFFGTISFNGAAGQYYYPAPVVLIATARTQGLAQIAFPARATAGTIQTFVGCYTLHMANSSNQVTPPFQPLGIYTASVTLVDNSADRAVLLRDACPAPGDPKPVPTTDPNNITAQNYLDERSSATNVLRSLFNAVNRKEYARAYAYWSAATSLPDFDTFAQGYLNTEAVAASFGEPIEDVGAGQAHYYVPAALSVVNTNGTQQFFVGCYALEGHCAMCVEPPFAPTGIARARVAEVASAAAANAQLANACATLP